MNQCSNHGVPNLFGLADPVYPWTAQAGSPCIAPIAAVCARSAPATRVDKSGPDTVLCDQCLTNHEARGMKARFCRSRLPWLVPVSHVVLDITKWLNQGQRASVIHFQWENLSVPGNATKKSPTRSDVTVLFLFQAKC